MIGCHSYIIFTFPVYEFTYVNVVMATFQKLVFIFVLIMRCHYGLCRGGRTTKKYQDALHKYHCDKSRHCTPERDSPDNLVCGKNRDGSVIAQFPNVCVFHGVNCFEQGRFYIIPNIKKCSNPNVTFGGLLELPFGSTARLYKTYLGSTKTTTESPRQTIDSSKWAKKAEERRKKEEEKAAAIEDFRKDILRNKESKEYSIGAYINSFIQYLSQLG